MPHQDLLSLDRGSYFCRGVFFAVRAVRAAGGAREFVLPCSNLGIGRVALRVSKTIQKCLEKDKVADIHLRQRVNSCRGKRKLRPPQNQKVLYLHYRHMLGAHMAL